jgi:hypothetical protein
LKVATSGDALMGLMESNPKLVVVDLNARSQPIRPSKCCASFRKDVRVVGLLARRWTLPPRPRRPAATKLCRAPLSLRIWPPSSAWQRIDWNLHPTSMPRPTLLSASPSRVKRLSRPGVQFPTQRPSNDPAGRSSIRGSHSGYRTSRRFVRSLLSEPNRICTFSHRAK